MDVSESVEGTATWTANLERAARANSFLAPWLPGSRLELRNLRQEHTRGGRHPSIPRLSWHHAITV